MKVGEGAVGVAFGGGKLGRLGGGWQFAPFGDGKRADVFVRRGEVGGDTETGGRAAGLEDGGEHLIVSIGRFDKELGAMVALGIGFEVFEGFCAGGVVDGEIADETKLLTVEAAGHECEQDRAGSCERPDGGPALVG